jgi:hypothetical protein
LKPWQLGNTSVRSAMRLRDGLIVLASSGREGALRGVNGDSVWRDVLGEAGIVQLGEDETNSVGRKWRAAMCRLGFLYDNVGREYQQQVGPMDFITPSGHRLIDATSGSAQQECYLRAIGGIWLDVSFDKHKVAGTFSPLRHVLRVLREVESKSESSGVTAVEFALFIQTTDNTVPSEEIVQSIFSHRSNRALAANKKRFDESAIAAMAESEGSVSASTYRDYMDMNLRYLKSTGLFRAFGRGISLVELKSVLIDALIADDSPPMNVVDYWTQLTNGIVLPTDDLVAANEALLVVKDEAIRRGLVVSPVPSKGAPVADVSKARHDIELQIALDDENLFYRAQRIEWEEIAEFLALLNGKKPPAGSDVIIPSGEMPAYFEWTLWRAFLAINSLANQPHEARKFSIDQDMRPLGHAPGGTPDLVFEFETFVLVVEVTLTTGIRQEGTEGVPVRHHVYKVQNEYPNKPVFGLFVAPKLAPSTIETFRIGKWFPPDADYSVDVLIVPTTIQHFRNLFVAMFMANSATPSVIRQVVELSIVEASKCPTPAKWGQAIQSIFEKQTAELVA